MTAVEAEAAGTLDAWLAEALAIVDRRLAAAEAKERAADAKERKIKAAIAEAGI
jgi:hypothetical protein